MGLEKTLCSSAAQNLLSCTLLSAMLHTVDHLPYIHEAATTPSLLELIILLFVCFSREYNYIQMVVKLYFSGVQNILLYV